MKQYHWDRPQILQNDLEIINTTAWLIIHLQEQTSTETHHTHERNIAFQHKGCLSQIVSRFKKKAEPSQEEAQMVINKRS